MRALGAALLELGLIAAAPALLLVVRYFSWGAGPFRLATFCALFALLAGATARRGYLRSPWDRGALCFWPAAFALGLIALHVLVFARDLRRGGECLTDMGRPSLCAGEWLVRGYNPWAQCLPRALQRTAAHDRDAPSFRACARVDRCIDRKAGGTYRNWTHHGSGFDFMDGYKYGPLLALGYAPFAHFFQERGLWGVNFLFWIAQCALLVLLARAAFPEQRAAPARALIGWLLPLVLPMSLVLPHAHATAFGSDFTLSTPEADTFILELTRRCSNDIIPVVLALLSVWLAARGRSASAGVALGLSLATKQLPGLLFAALLPHLPQLRVRRFVAAALLVSALFYLPFFAWAPREMVANLVLFGLVRPTNSSSVRAYLPPAFGPWIGALQLGLSLLILWQYYARAPRDLPALLRTAALLSVAFVALNKVVHGNYLLWLQPPIALAMAGLPFRGEVRDPRA